METYHLFLFIAALIDLGKNAIFCRGPILLNKLDTWVCRNLCTMQLSFRERTHDFQILVCRPRTIFSVFREKMRLLLNFTA